jgi:bacillithiol system protein YtxJ
MNWSLLESTGQIEQIKKESNEQPVLIFKHSTRCNISRTVLSRLERNWPPALNAKIYFLDLLSFREISSRVADVFEVVHESPQVLIIKNGKAVWHESHLGIDFQTMAGELR